MPDLEWEKCTEFCVSESHNLSTLELIQQINEMFHSLHIENYIFKKNKTV